MQFFVVVEGYSIQRYNLLASIKGESSMTEKALSNALGWPTHVTDGSCRDVSEGSGQSKRRSCDSMQ